MASSRDTVKMSEQEVLELLEESFKVQFASNGPGGHPHLTTLFYVVEDGKIAFWTYGTSQKVRNLERDPRVSALVEAGDAYAELRGVSIQGTAEIVRDPARIREVGGRVAARLAGVSSLEELGETGVAGVERQVAKRVLIVVNPDKVASWDHRKLA